MLKYVARASLIMLPCLLWAGTDISGSRSGCWYAAREVPDSHLLKNRSFSHTIMAHNAEQVPGGDCSCCGNSWLKRPCPLSAHHFARGTILDNPWKVLSSFRGGLAGCAGVSTPPLADVSIYFFKRKWKYEVILVFFFLYRHNQTDTPTCTWLSNI